MIWVEISSKLQFWIWREKGLFGAHFATFGPIWVLFQMSESVRRVSRGSLGCQEAPGWVLGRFFARCQSGPRWLGRLLGCRRDVGECSYFWSDRNRGLRSAETREIGLEKALWASCPWNCFSCLLYRLSLSLSSSEVGLKRGYLSW